MSSADGTSTTARRVLTAERREYPIAKRAFGHCEWARWRELDSRSKLQRPGIRVLGKMLDRSEPVPSAQCGSGARSQGLVGSRDVKLRVLVRGFPYGWPTWDRVVSSPD